MAKVLVIDDSLTTVSFVRAALAPDGHEVSHLESFVTLPRILAESPPDLVLLDLKMPGLSGRQLGHVIRREERKSIPVVIFSSSDPSEMQAIAGEIDAIAWIQKTGVTADVLRWEINKTLVRAMLHGFSRGRSSALIKREEVA